MTNISQAIACGLRSGKQSCYEGLYVQGQEQKFFKAKAKTFFKAKDTYLFQGQLQGQRKIRIAATDKIVG